MIQSRDRVQNSRTILFAIIGTLLTTLVRAELFVVNNANGTIGKYSLAGATINAAFISGLNDPTGLALAGGHLYVAESARGVIKKYTTSGTLVNPALITGLYGPLGVEVDDNCLYVANGGGESSTVGKYTTWGQTINAALIRGLGNPSGIAVYYDILYVAEWHTGRVGKYTIDGLAVNAALLQTIYPGGLAVDENGRLFVSTLYGGVNGNLVPGGTNSGLGLAVDDKGNIFYANNYNGEGGNSIGKYTTARQVRNASLITGLHNPVDIVLVPETGPTNQPPVADAGPDLIVECSGAPTSVMLNGTRSNDPDGDALHYRWWEGAAELGSNAILKVNLASGEHSIRMVVSDYAGQSAEDTVQVTIHDTTPPRIVNLEATPALLWPPNGQMVPVLIHASVRDACDVTASARIVAVERNQRGADNGDWEITGPLSVNLRSERLGKGRERAYGVFVEASDNAGNKSTNTVWVVVSDSRSAISRPLSDVLGLTGGVDPTFIPELETNFHVHVVSEQANGKLLVAGKYDGIESHRLAVLRLNGDGSLDRKFLALEWTSNDVSATSITGIRQRPDGKIMVTGQFESYRGHPRTNLLLLQRNGRVSAKTFPVIGIASGIRSDGSVLYMGRNQNSYYGNGLYSMSPDGETSTNMLISTAEKWSSLSSPQIGPDDSALGLFYRFSTLQQIYRVTPSNTVYWQYPPPGVRSIAGAADGSYYVAGDIDYGYEVVESNRWVQKTIKLIARFTNGLDASFRCTAESFQADGRWRFNGWPKWFSMAPQSDGKLLYTASDASVYDFGGNEHPTFYFGRLNSDGSYDQTFSPLALDEAVRISVLRDGRILVAGEFLKFGNMPRTRLARMLP